MVGLGIEPGSTGRITDPLSYDGFQRNQILADHSTLSGVLHRLQKIITKAIITSRLWLLLGNASIGTHLKQDDDDDHRSQTTLSSALMVLLWKAAALAALFDFIGKERLKVSKFIDE